MSASKRERECDVPEGESQLKVGTGTGSGGNLKESGVFLVFLKDIWLNLILPLLNPSDVIALHNTCKALHDMLHSHFDGLEKQVNEIRGKYSEDVCADFYGCDCEPPCEDAVNLTTEELSQKIVHSLYHNDMESFGGFLWTFVDCDSSLRQVWCLSSCFVVFTVQSGTRKGSS